MFYAIGKFSDVAAFRGPAFAPLQPCCDEFPAINYVNEGPSSHLKGVDYWTHAFENLTASLLQGFHPGTQSALNGSAQETPHLFD